MSHDPGAHCSPHTWAWRLRSFFTSTRCGPGFRSPFPPPTRPQARPSGDPSCGSPSVSHTSRGRRRSCGAGTDLAVAEGAAHSMAVRPIGWSGLWLALGALALVLVAGVLFGTAAILLVGCVVAGSGITY